MLSPRRNLAVLFAAILIGAALVLAGCGSSGDDSATSKAGGGIWSVGDSWVVKVNQDSSSISPDTKKSTALIPFTFKVVSAPKSSKGEWLVRVKQEGAEGPFKDGWRLAYTYKNDQMILTHVGSGGQKMIEATVASIVLGSNFPYEVKYTSAPKSETVDSSTLSKRSALPPLPNGAPAGLAAPTGDSTEIGAKPPIDAPIVKPGQLPPGAPPGAKG